MTLGEVSEAARLPDTWQELEEWLRFPGADDDVEAFVWDVARQLDALHRPPPHAGRRPPAVHLPTLLDRLVTHYQLEGEAAEEARAALEGHLLKVDVDYVES